jgi:hypothetical protein
MPRTMTDSLFVRREDGRFEPGELARGPWDPGALHGGAPAALVARAFERTDPGSQLPIARLGFEFLSPIPFTPLEMSTRVVRDGKPVQELVAELTAGERVVCRATALRVQPVPAGLPAAGPRPARTLAGREHGTVRRFTLEGSPARSLAASMEMSWLDDPRTPGPGRVWMRLRHPLLGDERATPLARLVATADFGNGVSSELPFEEYLFINADLAIHLWRAPAGEWIGLDARTLLHGGGMGVAESVLHDSSGPVGRAFQTLVVQPR